MGQIAAPPQRRPVRWRAARPLIVGLMLAAGAACRGEGARSRTAHAAEPPPAAAAPQDAAAPGGGSVGGGSVGGGSVGGGSADEVCEWAAWMVDDALAIQAEQAGEPVSGLLGEKAADGCRITAVGSFADLPEDVETPVDLLFEAFDDSGWHEDLRFAADTEDSSAIGMWKGGILCVAGAVWTVSEEMEYEEYEPTEEELRYDVAMECAPAAIPPRFMESFS